MNFTMLSITFRQIATHTATSKLAVNVLTPAMVAISVRYAGSLRNSKSWMSTQARQDESCNIPHLRNPTTDHTFDVNELAKPQQLQDKKLTSDILSLDHSFDVSEDYEKAAVALEHTATKDFSRNKGNISTEEVLEVVLEPDDFTTDHTFDVNEARTLKTLKKDGLEPDEFITDHTFDVNEDKLRSTASKDK
jgi:hypothetical protein